MKHTVWDTAEAYEKWKNHKSFANLINLYKNSFNGGNPIWKFNRLITGLVCGRYERFYQYWKKTGE